MQARERNPYLLKAMERFEDDKNYYFISELKSGGEFISYVTGKKLKLEGEALAKRVIKQVGEGLRELHKRLIIHRDIKLQNILVSDQYSKTPSFTLADYGSAA